MSKENKYEAAEYDGKKVTLNKPFRLPKGNSKKFAVYVKNEKGNVVKVRFGDPNMEIKRDNPKRRKAFRDRHNCSNPGPKWKARYWSCKMWSSKPVKDLTSKFDKSDESMASVMGCGCGCDNKAVEAAIPNPSNDETHDEYMGRCIDAGYSNEECMAAHEGHDFKEAGYGDSCPPGKTMKNGKCIKVAVTTDVTITDVTMSVEASTGNAVVQITGVAFHEGTNKNGWSITRIGAEQLLPQMIGADVTLNHPTAENGHFTRNMDGGIDEAVVGVITDAFFDYGADGESWDIRFKANILRQELFEALESGLWLRDGYGVSIGGTGIPDEILESEEGQVTIIFESDFTFDHLAIVHRPAYERARIDTAEKVEMPLTVKYQPLPPQINGDMENMTSSENENDTDEKLLSEIESLKADLILRNAEIEAFQAAEQAKAETERQTLVEKASELGLKGHDELSTEVIANLIESWEISRPQTEEPVVMEPVVASVTEETDSESLSEPMVANYFNKERVEVAENTYAKAYNLWVSAWNGTLTPQEKSFRAKTYQQIKEMI